MGDFTLHLLSWGCKWSKEEVPYLGDEKWERLPGSLLLSDRLSLCSLPIPLGYGTVVFLYNDIKMFYS
jgi:hypothetical protein